MGGRDGDDLARLLRADAARWLVPQEFGDPAAVTPLTWLKLVVRHPPLRAMVWFRLGNLCSRRGVRMVPSWVQRRLLRLYGVELAIGASIGGGLYVAHPVGCVLNAEVIGDDVTVIAQVTFGTRTDGRWPRVADRAFFGAGARVLGGVEIGADSQIGANAVVLDDVAPGAVVVGVPARPVA